MKNLVLILILLLSLNTHGQQVSTKKAYGQHIVTFSPLQIINMDIDATKTDLAVGLSYEYIMDNGLLGLKLPISYTINEINNTKYISPTVKFYPFKQGMVKYAIGPQFIYSFGQDTYDMHNGLGYVTMKENRRQLGFALNNSLNITISKNLYMVLDGGIGFRYYDSFKGKRYRNYYFDNLQPISLIFFNFGFGARF